MGPPSTRSRHARRQRRPGQRDGREKLWDIDADTWSSVPSGELPIPERASGAIDADGVLHLLTREDLATAVRLSSSDDGGTVTYGFVPNP